MRTFLMLLVVVAGCDPAPNTPSVTGNEPEDSGDPTNLPPDDDPPGGACGDFLYHDVVIRGLVENADGSPAMAADVVLEERNFMSQFQYWGKGTQTDANGAFEFTAVDLLEVEDCWGTLVDYNIVARSGTTYGEDAINSVLRNAITYGTAADLSAFPVRLKEK